MISIPSSVKCIGDGAFYYCRKLKKAVLANGVLSIGKKAFERCEALIDIEIPCSVTNIGEYAFKECPALKAIRVDSSNQYYSSMGSVLITRQRGQKAEGAEGSGLVK